MTRGVPPLTLTDFTLVRCVTIPTHVHNANPGPVVGQTYYVRRRFPNSELLLFWNTVDGDPFTKHSSYVNTWTALRTHNFVVQERFLETCFAAPCSCPADQRMHSGWINQEFPHTSRLEKPVEITRCQLCWKAYRADGKIYDEAARAAAWKTHNESANETAQEEAA